ncbi:MAG TPA: N-acetyltransferase [Acidimicrobiales bacterium]|jgi:putative acetyltransferase|nr:N-acetyltransferase [Acidimicrobiales bacterium]
MKPVLRRPRPGEEDAILAVVFAAFSSPGRAGDEEVEIVRGSWAAGAPASRLELVADVDGAVAGHVLAVPGRLDGRASAVAGVAPVCVAPSHQGRGVGSALMWELVGHAADRGWPLLVLLGEPAFYARFGFEPAGPLGLTYPPAGADSPHFLARRLGGDDASLRGTYTYCWEPG